MCVRPCVCVIVLKENRSIFLINPFFINFYILCEEYNPKTIYRNDFEVYSDRVCKYILNIRSTSSGHKKTKVTVLYRLPIELRC